MTDSIIQDIPLARVKVKRNDRTEFPEPEIIELAENIREYGLAQPITVRPIVNGTSPETWYELVMGERRTRAFRYLGRETIPAIVRVLADEHASALMLAENLARANLNPIDEGNGYAYRMQEFGWSEEDCAVKAGVSIVRVKFALKLLRLRSELQALVKTGDFQKGYAQILADAGLDRNRQMLAFNALRDNPSPTTGWFRQQVVNVLLEQQSQEALFDCDSLLAPPQPLPTPQGDPPHPDTHTPPDEGATASDLIRTHARYWRQAAEQWGEVGKPFKRQECLAAARSLELVLAVL